MSTLGYGAIVAVIGIATVFVGLIILIAFVMIMGKIFQAATKPKAPKQAAAAPAPVPTPAPVVEATPVAEEAPVVDDAELIAVIAAAIAAYDNNKTLVVRNVRRVSGWNGAARREQVYRF